MSKKSETTVHSLDKLKMRQNLPLDLKIGLTKNRIRSWYDHWHGNVHISFSGGKDSTVLLDIVRQDYPEVPAVFVDTGLEYPEIRDFVKTIDNVVWLKPKMGFKDVLKKYGYPVISKETSQKIHEIKTTKSDYLRKTRLYGYDDGRKMAMLAKKWRFLLDAPFKISNKCCDVMKKRPLHQYEKQTNLKAYTGVMAAESFRRKTNYIMYGCNAFKAKRPTSHPLMFWQDADVWEYLKTYNVPYSPIYDMGYNRTGCMFCMFGIQNESQPNRFQRMAETHPKQYRYCIETLGLEAILDYINIPYKPYKEYPLFDK